MKRWQWWMVGLALVGAVFALLIVFWPKIVECVERGWTNRRRKDEEPAEIEAPEVAG
ncbi:MAG TPA: hypothetical protein VM118_06535 [Acidobacteriota bacterium]|nr:hypothetical protein [Acidobacteriota bacterium]